MGARVTSYPHHRGVTDQAPNYPGRMTDTARGNRMLTIAFVLFAIGLVAVVAIFVLAAMDKQAPWLWMVTMGLPLGLILGIGHAVRRR